MKGLQLELRFRDSLLEIQAVRYPNNMLPFTISHHTSTLVDTIHACISSPSAAISALLAPTASDLSAIWSWTSPLPPTYNSCMHTMIARVRINTTPSLANIVMGAPPLDLRPWLVRRDVRVYLELLVVSG